MYVGTRSGLRVMTLLNCWMAGGTLCNMVGGWMEWQEILYVYQWPDFVNILYCCSCLVCVCVLLSYVYLLYCVSIAVFTLDAGLLARSQYSEGPATGHFDTGFSWFPCVHKQMLRWFPRFQVATTCFSCSPPDLNLLVTNFIFFIHVNWEGGV